MCRLNVLLSVGTYNICADFFSDRNPQHVWSKRKQYLPELLQFFDVVALQEISGAMANDLFDLFPNRRFVFFQQCATSDFRAGDMFTTQEEIQTLVVGKFLGTPMLGIMYDPETVAQTNVTEFWYNEHPLIKPTATDRAETDKGFGNFNTPRMVGGCQFLHRGSEKPFWFFTSRAPISGGAECRRKCFQLENDMIAKIRGDIPFFSAGDRNMIPVDSDDEMAAFDAAYAALTPPGVFDWTNSKVHIGQRNTWLGYQYEPKQYQNQIVNGQFAQLCQFDVGTSSLRAIESGTWPCVIQNDKLFRCCNLNDQANADRNFVSDHAFVYALFKL